MNYNVTVNGKVYNVSVERTGAAAPAAPAAPAPVAAAPVAAPVAAPAAAPAPAPAPATALIVSLHTLAGIRDERTMLLPVMIHGERLVALLDTGSTHNFLPETTMRRLAL